MWHGPATWRSRITVTDGHACRRTWDVLFRGSTGKPNNDLDRTAGCVQLDYRSASRLFRVTDYMWTMAGCDTQLRGQYPTETMWTCRIAITMPGLVCTHWTNDGSRFNYLTLSQLRIANIAPMPYYRTRMA